MRTVEIIRRPSADEQAALTRFVAERSADLGTPALSDHLALDLAAGGAPGFVVVTISDDHGIAALAQISAANTASAMEVVVRTASDAARPVRDDVVETAVDSFRRSGGGMLAWWVDEPTMADRALALRLGLHPGRVLHEMRRPLPLDRRATVVTRSFVPGVDDLAWLDVNNRAFAAHGEQGGWTTDTLRTRVAEPWFDANGFRLYEQDGRLAGFCWTKVHDDTDPVLGEIYVIGVDPDFHGRGLGRELTLAGLDALADQGVGMANLYVDADNIAAVTLYDRLGFGIHRSRQVFAGELTPIHEPEDA